MGTWPKTLSCGSSDQKTEDAADFSEMMLFYCTGSKLYYTAYGLWSYWKYFSAECPVYGEYL